MAQTWDIFSVFKPTITPMILECLVKDLSNVLSSVVGLNFIYARQF